MKIIIENYSKTLNRSEVLKNVNLTLSGGKIYGLKGKNGSGKTMLMRAICGLIVPTKGSVQIDDYVLGEKKSFPDSVGLLLENPAFLKNYTGYKNLKMLADIQKKVGEKEVREAIQRVGLDPDDKRTYRKYSLGMKQRLGIAAAIMEHPKLLILDEPINALDEAGAKLVRDILSEEKSRGALCIIACHDTEELNYLSDEIIEISDGEIKKTYENEKVGLA
jgi:ABC-2 type transport system ATP-binding protein